MKVKYSIVILIVSLITSTAGATLSTTAAWPSEGNYANNNGSTIYSYPGEGNVVWTHSVTTYEPIINDAHEIIVGIPDATLTSKLGIYYSNGTLKVSVDLSDPNGFGGYTKTNIGTPVIDDAGIIYVAVRLTPGYTICNPTCHPAPDYGKLKAINSAGTIVATSASNGDTDFAHGAKMGYINNTIYVRGATKLYAYGQYTGSATLTKAWDYTVGVNSGETPTIGSTGAIYLVGGTGAGQTVYKISSTGSLLYSTAAPVVTCGAVSEDTHGIALDSSDTMMFWAGCGYVYKVTSGGTKTSYNRIAAYSASGRTAENTGIFYFGQYHIYGLNSGGTTVYDQALSIMGAGQTETIDAQSIIWTLADNLAYPYIRKLYGYSTNTTNVLIKTISASGSYSGGSTTIDSDGRMFGIIGGSLYMFNQYPAPLITSWGNNFTNDQTLNFTNPTKFNTIKFNITANQEITTWSWAVSGVPKTNNYDNYSTSFLPGYNTVTVYGTGANGSTQTITWQITTLSNLEGYVRMLDVDGLIHPLENISVRLNATMVNYTNASGYYIFYNVTNYSYNVSVSKSLAMSTENQTLIAGNINNITLNYSKDSLSTPELISGKITTQYSNNLRPINLWELPSFVWAATKYDKYNGTAFDKWYYIAAHYDGGTQFSVNKESPDKGNYRLYFTSSNLYNNPTNGWNPFVNATRYFNSSEIYIQQGEIGATPTHASTASNERRVGNQFWVFAPYAFIILVVVAMLSKIKEAKRRR